MNKLFKALSDPSRRKMLELLVDEDMSAGEISDCFNMTKPSISHHLNVLKEAKLILSEKQGTSIIYSLNTTVFQEAIKWLFEISKKG
ncbi:MAG: winged helix-turn-helix transcriptional regulator [Clostridiales bacterium]|nr:winged helix-turn-helix transcriptional regulator [Clostridiales bacterium]